MPRWLRVLRGMIGTGLTFAVGVGAATTLFGAIVWLRGGVQPLEVLRFAGRLSLVSFLLGVAFSGVLALIARGRGFSKLSLPLVTGVGAGAGILYWLFLRSTGGRVWTPRDALGNFVLLIVMGGVSAGATLLIARRGRSSLGRGDELRGLGEGEPDILQPRHKAKSEVPKR